MRKVRSDAAKLHGALAPRPARPGKVPPAPAHLSRESRRLWRRVVTEWVLDEAAQAVLLVGLEALDRLREAQAIVKRDGVVTVSPRGAVRASPALKVEAQSRAAFLAALKQLGLEEEVR